MDSPHGQSSAVQGKPVALPAQTPDMNHGENDPDEPVRKHARHEDGLTPGVSSTDPIAPPNHDGDG